MLQRFPIAPAQVKSGKNSDNLLDEIGQKYYSLYQSKEITKKVYNNTIKPIQRNCKYKNGYNIYKLRKQ